MKTLIMITMIGLLFSCGNETPQEKEANRKGVVSEKSKEDESGAKTDKVVDKSESSQLNRYVPLIPGSYFYYEGTLKNGDKYKGKHETKQIINNEGDTLFYFIDDDGNASENIFGQSMFRYKKGDLMTMPSNAFMMLNGNTDILKEATTAYENLLIPSEPVIGDQFELIDKNNAWVKHLEIEAFESIQVPAGSFENCLKVSIKTEWKDDGTINNEQVWLKKGIGMIKWIRATGRVDELIKYNISQ